MLTLRENENVKKKFTGKKLILFCSCGGGGGGDRVSRMNELEGWLNDDWQDKY